MMVSRLKKVLLLTLVFSIIASLITGCNQKNPSDDTTVAITAKPEELHIVVRELWPGVTYDNFNTKYIEEKTYTKLKLTVLSLANGGDQLNVMLASGVRPEIIHIGGNESYETNYVREGILLPLNKYFDKAPNLKKRIEKIINVARREDGNVYTINASAGQDPWVPSYRKDWLDKFGLGIPQTLDEYMIVADAVSNKDPDGNNRKDTFAIGCANKDMRPLHHIFSAYGVIPQFWYAVDGTLVNGTVQPGAREALRTLNKLYTMEAIDPEFVTDNSKRLKEKYAQGRYGAFCYGTLCFDTFNSYGYYKLFHDSNPGGEWVYGPILRGPGYNEKIGMQSLSEKGWLRTAVCAAAKNIDAAIRVLDWMCTDEGQMFTNYGVEGQHYTMKDGIVNVTIDDVQKQELGITQMFLAQDVLNLHYSKEYRQAYDFASKLLTPMGNDGLDVPESRYQVEWDEYARTQYFKIITGEVPVDAGFDQLLAQWRVLHGDELAAAYNTAYRAKQKQ